MYYFIKNDTNDFGSEIMCYFNGSSGRISKKEVATNTNSSIVELENFDSFATDSTTGFYFFT